MLPTIEDGNDIHRERETLFLATKRIRQAQLREVDIKFFYIRNAKIENKSYEKNFIQAAITFKRNILKKNFPTCSPE